MPEIASSKKLVAKYLSRVGPLSGRPSRGPEMAVPAVAAGDQAESGSAAGRCPRPLPAEEEGAGWDQEDLGEQELRYSRGNNPIDRFPSWINGWKCPCAIL